jgi:WhiB family redox-sensing transcriptional regulator
MFRDARSSHHCPMNLLEASARDAWQQAGACRHAPGVNFYPETEREARPAKRICLLCPVRQICLETALRNGERYGVWGGLTERERLRLGRRRRAA